MKMIATRTLLIFALICIGVHGMATAAHAKPTTTSQTGVSGSQQSDSAKKRWLKRLIVEEAIKTSNVAPSVALAVAEVESGFRSHVVSSAGAIGVMQIMPRTGRDVFGLSRDDLFEPKTNIRAGVTFLDQLIDRYEGRIDLALSHYNGGSRVTAGPQPKIIPATRGYVIKVLTAARAYRTQLAGVAEEAPADPAFHAAARSPSPAPATEDFAKVPVAVSTPPVLGTAVWHQHLREADFWVATAQATREAGALPISGADAGTGPAKALVARLQNNRQAFRHWLKVNR